MFWICLEISEENGNSSHSSRNAREVQIQELCAKKNVSEAENENCGKKKQHFLVEVDENAKTKDIYILFVKKFSNPSFQFSYI